MVREKVIMNIKELIKAAQKPALYTPGTASMWQDDIYRANSSRHI